MYTWTKQQQINKIQRHHTGEINEWDALHNEVIRPDVALQKPAISSHLGSASLFREIRICQPSFMYLLALCLCILKRRKKNQ